MDGRSFIELNIFGRENEFEFEYFMIQDILKYFAGFRIWFVLYLDWYIMKLWDIKVGHIEKHCVVSGIREFLLLLLIKVLFN